MQFFFEKNPHILFWKFSMPCHSLENTVWKYTIWKDTFWKDTVWKNTVWKNTFWKNTVKKAFWNRHVTSSLVTDSWAHGSWRGFKTKKIRAKCYTFLNSSRWVHSENKKNKIIHWGPKKFWSFLCFFRPFSNFGHFRAVFGPFFGGFFFGH